MGLISGLFWSGAAWGGKLGDLRGETGGSDRSHGSDNDHGAYDDGCSLLAALFGACRDDTAEESAPPALMTGVPAAAQSPVFFPLYPYRGRAAGNLVRRRYPSDLEATFCTPEDVYCHRQYGVVTCVDNVCLAPTPNATYEELTPVSDTQSVLPNTALPKPLDVGAEDTRPSSSAVELGPAERVQSGRLQLQLDGGQDRDGLYRGTVGGSVDGVQGWGLESRFTLWLEPAEEDYTWLGDFNLRFAVLTLPALQLRFGLGPRVQWDASSRSAGVNFTSGLELYPASPIVVRLDADVGNLGDALVLESQATLGLLFWRTELLAGVGTLRVGSVAFDSLFAGVRFHL
jgi:hypothetical protein